MKAVYIIFSIKEIMFSYLNPLTSNISYIDYRANLIKIVSYMYIIVYSFCINIIDI